MPSTVIRSFRYSARRRELRILFQSGKEYAYFDVPAELYENMQIASSKGEFFNQQIRGKFAFRRNVEMPHAS
jgi:lysyl-tRNA synthetase class 2